MQAHLNLSVSDVPSERPISPEGWHKLKKKMDQFSIQATIRLCQWLHDVNMEPSFSHDARRINRRQREDGCSINLLQMKTSPVQPLFPPLANFSFCICGVYLFGHESNLRVLLRKYQVTGRVLELLPWLTWPHSPPPRLVMPFSRLNTAVPVAPGYSTKCS